MQPQGLFGDEAPDHGPQGEHGHQSADVEGRTVTVGRRSGVQPVRPSDRPHRIGVRGLQYGPNPLGHVGRTAQAGPLGPVGGGHAGRLDHPGRLDHLGLVDGIGRARAVGCTGRTGPVARLGRVGRIGMVALERHGSPR